MSLIEQFRQDIENALAEFTRQNPAMSPLRSQNISDIRVLLQSSNPVKVCAKVADYVNKLSSGFVSLCFFMEVNRFKNSLQNVLALPMYQENAILKRVISEMGNQTVINGAQHSTSDKTLLARMESVESSLNFHTQQVDALRLEVKRLKLENQVLTKTITNLVEKNKHLAGECQKLKDDKIKIQADGGQLKLKYDQLLKENDELKKKMFYINTNSDSNEEQVPNKDELSSDNPTSKTKNGTQSKSSAYGDAQFFIRPIPKELIKNKCNQNTLPGRKAQSLILS